MAAFPAAAAGADPVHPEDTAIQLPVAAHLFPDGAALYSEPRLPELHTARQGGDICPRLLRAPIPPEAAITVPVDMTDASQLLPDVYW